MKRGVKVEEGVGDVLRYNVMIDPASATIMMKIGAGNLSRGIREAARRLQEDGNTTKFSAKRHEERMAKK